MRNAIFLVFVVSGCGGEPFSFNARVSDSDTGTMVSKSDGMAGDSGANSDSGTGGAGGAVDPSSDSGSASGGTSGSGGMVDTGGSPSGGAGATASGGAGGGTGGTTGTGGTADAGGTTGTGGSTNAGGTTSTGGTTACTLVTHNNGLGQTWQDCVPLGTHDQVQAMKACGAWCAVNVCSCSVGASSPCNDPLDRAHAGSGGFFMGWAWQGKFVGEVTKSSSTCDVAGTWN